MQPLYHARGNHECSHIFNDGAMRNYSAETNLQAVPVGMLFAPTQGSHFQSLHLFSFLFICTLHWCKHCTLLEVTMNVHKLPMTRLCVIAARILISRSVLLGMLFAPTMGSHFQALHPLSFLFIYTLHWCKHCTVL